MIVKKGLMDAIEKELNFASVIYHLDCKFTCTVALPAHSSRQEILLFRIVQENVLPLFSEGLHPLMIGLE